MTAEEIAPPANAPYRDASRPVDERVADLLARMTPAEKVAQLGSAWLTLDPDGGEFAPYQGVFQPRKGGPDLRHGLGQITRPLGSRPIEPGAGARGLAAFQRHLVEETRLGIPAIAHEEALTGFMTQGATQFPSPLNYGATWDPELIERVGAAIRRQLRTAGIHQALAPVADVIRDARWGRVEECVGEDPLLVGEIVCAYVRGLQGEDLATGVVATLKHFCAYSGSEGGRNFGPAHVGPRELRDVYLKPFEMAVREAGALSVMNAYNDIDGEPCAASRRLLTEILREEWGFDGIVVADYFAVSMLESLHHTAADAAEASAQALRAGLDVELPSAQCFPDGIPEALSRGLLDAEDVDRAVGRVLRLKFALGLFDEPVATPKVHRLETPEDRALAREVAEKSLVLLRNDGVLPLAEGTRLAVIGPNADSPFALLGNYSFSNHVAAHFPDHPVPPIETLHQALCARLGKERVTHARGCAILDPAEGPGPSQDRSGFADAVAAARAAEVAIVAVGDRAGHFRRGTVGEGTDTDDLSLPGVQAELVRAVLDTGTPTVLVLLNGRPFALGDLANRAAATLEAWFPGQEGAAAVAAALVGDVNPSGRSTVTYPRSAGAEPRSYDHKPLARGIPPSPSFEPVFAFGHGLSYTEFAYEDLAIEPAEVPVDGRVSIACRVSNRGARAGAEVVQLYLRDPVASVTRPVRSLAGFARVPLEPGQSRRVRFELSTDALAFSGPDLRPIVEPGRIEVALGASSADLRLEGDFRVVGETRVLGRDAALRPAVSVED